MPEVRRWSVYGGGDPAWRRRLARHTGVRFHGWYRARTLPGLLARDKVDLLLLPSLSPEAHCLVLDEGWTAGVPALASRRGALGERVSEVGGGWVADPSDFSSALAQRVRGPFEAIAEVRERIARWRPWTPEDAGGGILRLYRSLAGDAQLSHRIR
jgi:glycosyltransferase involved in cell wall biosynthesis